MADHIIDLRSDTMTRPTTAMRRAMADAEVGDDYYRDDPTVQRIEAMAAERLNKEAGMLVLSGTMGNLVAMLAHCRNGDALLAEERSHIFINEAGHIAGVCGITPRLFKADSGVPTTEAIRAVHFPDYPLHPRPTLLCLENSHNAAGGTCITAEETRELADTARDLGLKTHIDGARLFNAEVATGDSAASLSAPADTVTFCLTKGLGAPVGSMLCGPKDLIEAARRHRHMIGGGMRQAGAFAAAGIVALESGVDNLKADHDNTSYLAENLTKFGLQVDQAKVETNILFVQVSESVIKPIKLHQELKARGVLTNPPKGSRQRFVLHRDVSHEDIVFAVKQIEEIISAE